MSIELQWEVPGDPGDLEEFLGRVADACMELEGVAGARFAVRVVDAETIRALNREYRGVDRSTDVLSFPSATLKAGEPIREEEHPDCVEFGKRHGRMYLGSVVICKKRAGEQAEEYGHSYEREVCYLAVHGFLHCLGYDHMEEEEKKVMRAREEEIMRAIKLGREQ